MLLLLFCYALRVVSLRIASRASMRGVVATTTMDQQPSDQPPPYEPLEDGLHIPVDTKMDAFGLDLESEEQVQRFVVSLSNPKRYTVTGIY